jgi:DNA polymerase III subunit gamma/tau
MNENYLVLARKYRPSSFATLKGQSFLVTTLVNAIKLDRIAHTFLLTGIRGSGKTTTARIIAKTLNCTNPTVSKELVTPCEKCDNCQAASGEKHPDIIELDAASRTGVDDIRSIIENTHYLPLLGKYKIYIIDEVHMLSTSAFNALLKTLEEPPAHIKFIFATTEIRKIPITILSRCQKFELRRLNHDELTQHLQDILKQENIDSDKDALQLIAAHAEGSVRDSLSLLDLIISNANGAKITKEQTLTILGYSDNTQIITLFDDIVNGNTPEALAHIKKFYYDGKDLLYILQQLMELTHNISKIKLSIKNLNLEYTSSELDILSSLASKMTIPSLTILWQMLLKGLQELQITGCQLMAVEMLIIRICYISNIPTPAALIENSEEQPQKKTTTLPAPNQTKEKAVTAAPTTTKIMVKNFEELTQLFYQHREMLLYQYLVQDVHLIEFSPPKIKIRQTNNVPHNFAKKVSALLHEYTGDKWTIIIASEDGSPTLSSQAEKVQAEQIDELSKNDIVQEILHNFNSAQVKEVRKS